MNGYTDLTKMENSRNCLRRIARHDEQQFSKDSIVNVMEKFVKTVNVMDETILVPCRLMDRQVGDSTDIIQAPTKNSTSNQLTLNTFNANGKAHKKRSKNIHEFLNSAELFNLYSMLNALKNDLLWNRSDADANEDEEDEGIPRNTTTNSSDDNSTNVHSSSSSTDLNANNATGCSSSNISSSSTSSSASASASSSSSTSSSSASASSTTATTATTGSSSVKGHNRRPSTASMTSTTSVSNLSDSESEISNENDSGIESEGNCGNSQKGENQAKAANADKATELARQCRRHLSGLYQCLEQMTEAANYLTARYQSDIGPV